MDLYELKSKWNSLKNTVLQVTPAEAKARECTSDVPWGVKRSEMQEVAEYTHNYEDFKNVMKVVWERIEDKSSFRHVSKGLQLLEYLIFNGSDRVSDEARYNMSSITDLKYFHYRDESNKDIGLSVRELSEKLVKLLKDEKTLKKERKQAQKQKSKFQGISRREAQYSSSSSKSFSKSDSDEEAPEEEEPKVETKIKPPTPRKESIPKPVEKKPAPQTDLLDFFSTPSETPKNTVVQQKATDFFGDDFDVRGGGGVKQQDANDFDANFDSGFDDFNAQTTTQTNVQQQNIGGGFFDFNSTTTTTTTTNTNSGVFGDDDFSDFQKGDGQTKNNDLMNFTKDLVDFDLKTEKHVSHQSPMKNFSPPKKTVLSNKPVMNSGGFTNNNMGFNNNNNMGLTNNNNMRGFNNNSGGFNNMNRSPNNNVGGFNNTSGGFNNNMNRYPPNNNLMNKPNNNMGFNNNGGFNNSMNKNTGSNSSNGNQFDFF